MAATSTITPPSTILRCSLTPPTAATTPHLPTRWTRITPPCSSSRPISPTTRWLNIIGLPRTNTTICIRRWRTSSPTTARPSPVMPRNIAQGDNILLIVVPEIEASQAYNNSRPLTITVPSSSGGTRQRMRTTPCTRSARSSSRPMRRVTRIPTTSCIHTPQTC